MSTPLLATKRGMSVVLALLFGSGAMCPKCGYGTRATSKRWARCKKCGERVAREDMKATAKRLEERLQRNSGGGEA